MESCVPLEYFEEQDKKSEHIRIQLIRLVEEQGLTNFIQLSYIPLVEHDKLQIFEPEELFLLRPGEVEDVQMSILKDLYRKKHAKLRYEFLMEYGMDIPLKIWCRTMAHLILSEDISHDVATKMGIKL